MKKYRTAVLCASALILFAGPAMANHCDIDISNVDAAAASVSDVQANVLDAVVTLVEHGIAACEHEEAQLMTPDADSPILRCGTTRDM